MIKARHVTRTMVVNGKEVQAERLFTDRAWKNLKPVVVRGYNDNKPVPKEGWVRISDGKTPPEAKKKAAAKKSEPKEPASPAVNIQKIEGAIVSGKTDQLTIDDVAAYVEAKGLDIAEPKKMPLPDLIDKVKEQL